MSEEQKEKPRVERIADALNVTGIFVLVASVPWGIYLSIQNDNSDLTLLAVWGLGLFAWLVCRFARYILKGVISEVQKEKPNMVGRLGLVLYLWGVGLAGVSLLLGIVWAIDMANLDEDVIKIWASGAGAYFVGRGARYVLKGD